MKLHIIAIYTLVLILSPLPLGAATFVVNSDRDGENFHDTDPGDGFCLDLFGQCALRTALEEANGHSGADVINFSAAMTITLNVDSGALPPLTEQTTISATSVWDTANNKPGVTLSGNGMDIWGLSIIADWCEIYGLYITHFGEGAISIDSAYNIIGGLGTGQRNLLSGNGASGNGVGVYIVGSSAQHNILQNNYIGVNPAGNAPVPNYLGVAIVNGASNNIIGRYWIRNRKCDLGQ